MNRCIRCDTEHHLSERGLCPSCEFIVTAGLPKPAPVAPTSADGARRPEPGQFITVPELIAFLEDASVDQSVRLLGVKIWLRDYGALNAKQQEEIKLLTAANAALQAELDGFISGKTQPTGRGTFVPQPNGGETAAHLCSVIGCGKVATHVSDVPYRDGVQAHYCDEHTLHEWPIETAADAPHSELGRDDDAQRRDAMRETYKQVDAEDRGTPEQPATARKLSKAQRSTPNRRDRKFMQAIIDAGGWISGGKLTKASREMCDKRPDWFRREYYGGQPGYALTKAGVAALAARESEAGKK